MLVTCFWRRGKWLKQSWRGGQKRSHRTQQRSGESVWAVGKRVRKRFKEKWQREGLGKEGTLRLTEEKWRTGPAETEERGGKVSAFVEKCPLLLTWTFLRRGQQRWRLLKGSTAGYTRHDRACSLFLGQQCRRGMGRRGCTWCIIMQMRWSTFENAPRASFWTKDRQIDRQIHRASSLCSDYKEEQRIKRWEADYEVYKGHKQWPMQACTAALSERWCIFMQLVQRASSLSALVRSSVQWNAVNWGMHIKWNTVAVQNCCSTISNFTDGRDDYNSWLHWLLNYSCNKNIV